ncbi:MAG: hypothetical protein K8L99_13495 [Anaerolineae bacterium]|nr:hypothetical protein [Anaerolineae bacterium]
MPVVILSRMTQRFRGQVPAIEGEYPGDSEPFYVTAKIAAVDQVFNSSRFDRERLQGLAAQLPQALPDVVGCEIVEDILWAKVYIAPGDARERLRMTRRRGGKFITYLNGMNGRPMSLRLVPERAEYGPN